MKFKVEYFSEHEHRPGKWDVKTILLEANNIDDVLFMHPKWNFKKISDTVWRAVKYYQEPEYDVLEINMLE